MRVGIVYDCLYPWTVGGAERWYRTLAEQLATKGHEVTVITRRQWAPGDEPRIPGVRVTAASAGGSLYAKSGRRRILPPLVFGAGVFRHLLRHGSDYDLVHTASFPYFPLLAAAALRRRCRYRLVVDWHEVWTREYWQEYLGAIGGRAGWLVQRACLRVDQVALCFSRLHERRLREAGALAVIRLEGQFTVPLEARDPEPAGEAVVFAGRHVAEKGVTEVVPAFALAQRRTPGLRLDIYGDGPQHREVVRQIAQYGLGELVSAPGFVDERVLDQALRRALCLVLPSRREGFGLVVVEASARGVPSVVVAGPDNAAVELVEEGVNGAIAASADAEDIAAAILRVHELGSALRRSTVSWYRANARRLSFESSLATVLDVYGCG